MTGCISSTWAFGSQDWRQLSMRSKHIYNPSRCKWKIPRMEKPKPGKLSVMLRSREFGMWICLNVFEAGPDMLEAGRSMFEHWQLEFTAGGGWGILSWKSHLRLQDSELTKGGQRCFHSDESDERERQIISWTCCKRTSSTHAGNMFIPAWNLFEHAWSMFRPASNMLLHGLFVMMLYLTLSILIDHQALPACLKGLINVELDLIKQALEENPSAALQYPDDVKVRAAFSCLKHATVHLKQAC